MLDFRRFEGYNKTCPITSLEDKAVSFIRSEEYISYLKNAKEDIWVIVLKDLEPKIRRYQEYYCPTVNVYYSEYPEFDFVVFHNKLYENKIKSSPNIGTNCQIHESVILGADGLKVINAPNGEKIQFLHSGHVIIGDNVSIGAYSVVHRGLLGVTTIGSGTKIGSRSVIGYNCHIGKDNVIAPGVILNGGVHTGDNCWLGAGSLVKHYISMCDNIALGMGSIVVKDINESGVYAGNPVKYLKPMKENWNFW
jgi:UDP-3-O-[3-hydroxymyristoyl] glucosamine N-acyltransferase